MCIGLAEIVATFDQPDEEENEHRERDDGAAVTAPPAQSIPTPTRSTNIVPPPAESSCDTSDEETAYERCSLHCEYGSFHKCAPCGHECNRMKHHIGYCDCLCHPDWVASYYLETTGTHIDKDSESEWGSDEPPPFADGGAKAAFLWALKKANETRRTAREQLDHKRKTRRSRNTKKKTERLSSSRHSTNDDAADKEVGIDVCSNSSCSTWERKKASTPGGRSAERAAT